MSLELHCINANFCVRRWWKTITLYVTGNCQFRRTDEHGKEWVQSHDQLLLLIVVIDTLKRGRKQSNDRTNISWVLGNSLQNQY